MDPSQPACDPGQLSSEMDEVIKEFLVECNEGLDRFDRDLVALEKDRTSRELLDSIFRAIHTIKGTGGVLGYEKLISISHIGESVLSRMRDGLLLLSPPITTALLAMADALRSILQDIAAGGNEGDGDFSAMLQQLSAVLGQAQPPNPPKTPAIVTVPQAESAPPPLLGEVLVSSETCMPEDVAAVELQQEGDPRRLGQILVDTRVAVPSAVAEGLVGDWQGAVRLDIDLELARQACANLVGVGPADLSAQDISDAVGELANMTGGSVKTLCAPTSRLSLPSVAMGRDFEFTVSQGTVVQAVSFSHPSGVLTVSVIQKEAPGSN